MLLKSTLVSERRTVTNQNAQRVSAFIIHNN